MSDQRQGSGEIRCSKCNQTFSSNEELRKHNETQHQEKSQGAGAGGSQEKSSHAGSNR
jgi:hypothetical protein